MSLKKIIEKWSAYVKIIIVSLGSIVLLTGCSFLPTEEPQLAPPLIKPAPVQYNTAKVAKSSIEDIMTGTIDFVSKQSTDLSFQQVPGRITAINISLGSTVKKGEVLIALDKGNLEYQLQVAKINSEKDQIKFNQDLQSANAAAIETDKLQAQLDQLNISQIENEIAATEMISPSNGVVTSLSDLNIGDLPQSYQTLVTIQNPNQLQAIYTAISSSSLVGVQVGMPVDVTIKGKQYIGKVSQTPFSISNTAFNAKDTSLYKRSLIITLNKIPASVKMGDTADFSIVLQKRSNTLVIPRQALQQYFGNSYVQTLNGNIKKQVPVKIGIENSTQVQILKGLKAGENVILR